MLITTQMLFQVSEDASNTQCVTITIYDDEDMENDETFYITVTNPSFEDGPSNVTLSNSNFTVTIRDDNGMLHN